MTTAAHRFVGSVAPLVMENRQYRMPSLNAMIRQGDLSGTSSFSAAMAIEVRLRA